MTLVDDLLRAAEVLQERGWTQDGMESPDGEVCVIGAIRVATIGRATWNDLSDIAELEQITRFHDARVALTRWLNMPPTIWNDQRGRTQFHVKMALLNTARVNQNVGV